MLGFSPLAAVPLAAAGIDKSLLILNATEAKDVAAVSINIVTNATLAATEARDTASFSTVAYDFGAYLSATEAKDAASMAVIASNGVALAATEAKDTANINVQNFATVYFSVSELPDIASFRISNQFIVLNASEFSDIAALAITMSGSLSISASEAPDTYSQAAYILWLNPSEPDDPSIWVPKNDPAPYLTTVI